MDILPCHLFCIQTDYLPIIGRFATTDDRFQLWNRFPPLLIIFFLLLQSEVALMQGIIPSKHKHQVFERIILASMDAIDKEGQVGSLFNFKVVLKWMSVE